MRLRHPAERERPLNEVHPIADEVGTTRVLLSVCGLSKRYAEQEVLRDVSFSVGEAEIVGLIGPNGAGKTTVLEAIAGLIPVDAGTVVWRGEPLGVSERRSRVFYLPDGIRPWEDQYVVAILSFVQRVYGRDDDFTADVIHDCGLERVLQKRVKTLSKGYARRLMLGLGLLTPHPLLLMDEPFDGFDLRQTRAIMGVLRQKSSMGRTFLLAIHQLLDAERICDHFVLLADGRVRGVGTHEELVHATGRDGLEEVFLALT